MDEKKCGGIVTHLNKYKSIILEFIYLIFHNTLYRFNNSTCTKK